VQWMHIYEMSEDLCPCFFFVALYSPLSHCQQDSNESKLYNLPRTFHLTSHSAYIPFC
jgi:hypothetical protein